MDQSFVPQFKHKENTRYVIDGEEIWYSRSVGIVAVIFGMYNNELYVLTELRSKNMDMPGKRCVPGGWIDWDENAWDALRREVYEETSLVLDQYSQNVLTDNGKQPFFVMTEPTEYRQAIGISYFVAINFPEGLPDIESYTNFEVDEVKWMPILDVVNHEWAFNHDKRITMAANKLMEYITKKLK